MTKLRVVQGGSVYGDSTRNFTEYQNDTIIYDSSNGGVYMGNGSNDITVLSSSPCIEITYNDLKNLKNASKLQPGTRYRIIDYVTEAAGDWYEDTHYYNKVPLRVGWIESMQHKFDIIVTANSKNSFNKIAGAALSSDNDGWFDDDDHLEKWILYYDFDGLYDMYISSAKGTIYRMIDENGNDFPYDFKNIQIDYLNGSAGYPYAVNIFGENTYNTGRVRSCYNNVYNYGIVSVKNPLVTRIPFITLGSNSSNNIFNGLCYDIHIGSSSEDNVFNNSCHIILGYGCKNNVFNNTGTVMDHASKNLSGGPGASHQDDSKYIGVFTNSENPIYYLHCCQFDNTAGYYLFSNTVSSNNYLSNVLFTSANVVRGYIEGDAYDSWTDFHSNEHEINPGSIEMVVANLGYHPQKQIVFGLGDRKASKVFKLSDLINQSTQVEKI